MPKVRQSFSGVMKSFGNTVRAANRIVPGVIAVGVMAASGIIAAITLSASLMLGAAAVLVTFVSILVYARTSNYGEAAVALVAGLLTVFSVNWTPGLFTVFAFSWVGFSVITLIIASVRLAAQTEGIYVQAAIVLSRDGDPTKSVEKRLRSVGEAGTLGMLGPVERAEVIRIFALRRLPIEVMKSSLEAAELISTTTGIDGKTAAVFLADVYHSIGRTANAQFVPSLDTIYETIRASPVLPDEYFQAFRECRHLLLSGRIELRDLLEQIREALELGVPAPNVDNYLASRGKTI